MPESNDSRVTNNHERHRCIRGNFAPVHKSTKLTPCIFSGNIPVELSGGQYVRNGGNPSFGDKMCGELHMFDGDGMLSGVLFRAQEGTAEIVPCFVNQFILTDIFLATKSSPNLRSAIIPSISHFLDSHAPLSTFYELCRFIFLLILSNILGTKPIRSISVANTAILFHDKRVLATCQTGPPMRIHLPTLETVGWYDGYAVENESGESGNGKRVFGHTGLLKYLKNWTTAHPRVDQKTGELISFQSSFIPPFVWYSISPSTGAATSAQTALHSSIPGIASAKFMHDFGVSLCHCIILDLPMSLDPNNLLQGLPIIHFDVMSPSRFGVFPRRHPEKIRWFETEACFIFHTASTWDEESITIEGKKEICAVNMLACRYTSGNMLHSMGGIDLKSTPGTVKNDGNDSLLYYYRFELLEDKNVITHQWALSAIPFEMPILPRPNSMGEPEYIYGCSSQDSMFGSVTGEPMKINCLVKMNVKKLINRGLLDSLDSINGCVDERNIQEIHESTDPNDPITVFTAPPGWYVQEPRFVPRSNAIWEDDGYIMTFMFDESQLNEKGKAPATAKSELWIIDARNMENIVAKILLPQRVPYGFHGNWFSRNEIEEQRPFKTSRNEQWEL